MLGGEEKKEVRDRERERSIRRGRYRLQHSNTKTLVSFSHIKIRLDCNECHMYAMSIEEG